MDEKIKKKNLNNAPAFPIVNSFSISPGLTKREYISAQILSSLVSSFGADLKTDFEFDIVVERSLKLTDKLIEKLNEEQP